MKRTIYILTFLLGVSGSCLEEVAEKCKDSPVEQRMPIKPK
jgi:hypothetical protein